MKNSSGNPDRRLGPRPVGPLHGGPALSPARATVLEAVECHAEPVTLTFLAEHTGLHPNTLREHLEALEARGFVQRFRAAPSGRGRPAWLYTVAETDPAAAGSEYAGLAATLAAHIHHTSADPRADAMAAGRAWGRELSRRAGPPERPGAAAARRQVTQLLDEVGFCPEPNARATVVRLTRCPLLETAKEYPDVVCGVHLGIVRGALEEYGVDGEDSLLEPFSEPGACRLELHTREAR